jgi:hypothetical protein
VRVVASATQHFDVEGEVALFDKPILPDGLHQLVFFEQTAGVFDQEVQCVEDLRVRATRARFGRKCRLLGDPGESLQIRKIGRFPQDILLSRFLSTVSAHSQDFDSEAF